MRRLPRSLVLAIVTAFTVAIMVAAMETWMKTYGDGQGDMGHDVLLLGDGGYLIVGETTSGSGHEAAPRLLLLRLNAAGDVVWEKTYAAGRASAGAGLLAETDGGFIIAGTIQSDDGDDADALLLRVDADGNALWWKTIGSSRDEFIHTVRRTDRGYLLVGDSVDPNDVIADPGAAGYAGFAGRSNVYVAEADFDGNEIWSRRWETDDNVLSGGGAVAVDGGIVILAHILRYPIEDDDILLLKFDRHGDELLWSRTWTAGDASGYDLLATSDGGYLISGVVSFPDDPARAKLDALLIKVDATGNEIWSTTYGEPDKIETAHVVTETFDGRYVCAGWQMRDFHTFADDILLAAFDQDGALLWQDVTPSPAHNLHEALVQHPDGSLVIAGSAARPGRPFRVQLIKTDL